MKSPVVHAKEPDYVLRFLAVTIGDLSIAQLSDLSIRDAKDFLDSVTLEERSSVIAAPILTEIQARLKFLVDVGLSYLTLSRGLQPFLVVRCSTNSFGNPNWFRPCRGFRTSSMSPQLVFTNVTTAS